MLQPLSQVTRRFRPIIILLLLLVAAVGCTTRGTFGSNREPQEQDGTLSRQPVQVTMQELDSAPLAYVNRFIRVSGEFRPPAEPLCDDVRGPAPLWALVNGELHLQATGFNTILSLVPEGAMLTVEGRWRLYEGPAGCGKEPPPQTIWFLEAMQIVEPNPLPQFGLVVAEEPAVQDEESETATPTATPTEGTPTAEATEGTPTITPTVDPLLTPSPSPTPSFTPTPSVTPEEEATDTPEPEETPEPSPTTDSGSTPTSPAPTSPPGDGGYPPPPPPTQAPPGY